MRHYWDPRFTERSPLFSPLTGVSAQFRSHNQNDWPTLIDYQNLFEQYSGDSKNKANKPLHFVNQSSASKTFEDAYEQRIYLKGEIQTRLKNWHDFFQVLVWSIFTRSKIQLNALHYQAAKLRNQETSGNTNRSPVENTITLFDECGVILLSDKTEILELVRDFNWKKLFINNRSQIQQHLKCIIFGHALYEKSLTPYIGMTGHGLLLKIKSTFFEFDLNTQLQIIDDKITAIFSRPVSEIIPNILTPVPILGMPNWDVNNQSESYYDNENYFRIGRTKPQSPIFDTALNRIKGI